MKILNIGDVHGRDHWMFSTHGSPYEFNYWKVSVESGATATAEIWSDMPYYQYDKIIFVGDYCDSYDLNNETILQNLENIIFFKKALGDRVVLLLGNHDVQYIVPNEICSGFRSEMQFDLKRVLSANLNLFKMAHFEQGANGKWIWSHAGVTSEWFKELKRDMLHRNFRFLSVSEEFFQEEREVDEVINKAWEMRMDALWNVDHYSGGIDLWAGPIWVRPGVLESWKIEGYNQVVGHTKQKALHKVDFQDYSLHYIDVPYLDIDPLVLEI